MFFNWNYYSNSQDHYPRKKTYNSVTVSIHNQGRSSVLPSMLLSYTLVSPLSPFLLTPYMRQHLPSHRCPSLFSLLRLFISLNRPSKWNPVSVPKLPSKAHFIIYRSEPESENPSPTPSISCPLFLCVANIVGYALGVPVTNWHPLFYLSHTYQNYRTKLPKDLHLAYPLWLQLNSLLVIQKS